MFRGFDFIGDVHGSGEKLEGLLAKLGYTIDGGTYRHPDRQAIFVGDLIDRGPNQLRVLEVVKGMVDAGSAQTIMGNHEFNALAYAIPTGDEGEFCRPHSEKNRHQHHAFLDQLSRGEREGWLQWIMTLPLWLDLGEVRAVHACWHDDSIATINEKLDGCRFTSTDQVAEASLKESELYKAVELVLKGPELMLKRYGLPAFKDKDDHVRGEARFRWWASSSDRLHDLVEIPLGAKTVTGQKYPDVKKSIRIDPDDVVVPTTLEPTVYGHYWRRWGSDDESFLSWRPESGVDWTTHSACVDFSAVKGGPLVAYRWNDGDTEIEPSRYLAYR